jgi:uncharacterized protein (TIGR02147 family)
MSQLQIINILKKELLATQVKNPQYSIRSFSKKLKTNPSVISEILNGKRSLSLKNGEKFLDCLSVDPIQKKHLLEALITKKRQTTSATKKLKITDQDFELLDESIQFDVIANWYYFAILSLAETKNFTGDIKTIAARLRIKQQQAQKAIDQLIHLGLLIQLRNGKIKTTGAKFRTTTDISSTAIRKNHFDHLELLKRSLEEDDLSIRDFTAMTFTFDPKKMDLAKNLIKEFRRNFTEQMENQTQKNEVYRLSIQLIPISHGDNK